MSINKLVTAGEMQSLLSAQFKRARLNKNHSRAKAAKLTGVPEATIRAFETKSQLSLRQFLMLTHVYGDLSLCGQLFEKPLNLTLDELIANETKPNRQRGHS